MGSNNHVFNLQFPFMFLKTQPVRMFTVGEKHTGYAEKSQRTFIVFLDYTQQAYVGIRCFLERRYAYGVGKMKWSNKGEEE